MTNQPDSQAFELEVCLLEDLHTGSGMGSTVVDRLLARAADDTPIIPREHVKGVWRDNALRLAHLSRLGAGGQAIIDALFGAGAGTRGCLICPELRPDPGTHCDSLFWDATARKPGDRAPDDHSLRRTEYLPAGLTLRGRGALAVDRPELRAAVERIVRFTNALGSERTRGSGLIQARLTWLDPDPAVTWNLSATPATPAPDLSHGVRLLLRATAPLCIPTTGAPGNIIPSEHHIPGRTLFGALAAWLIDQGGRPDLLFARRLSIGPGYPLPATFPCPDSQTLSALRVIPIPLNCWSPKPGPRGQTPWPHWAGDVSGPVPAPTPDGLFRDMLADRGATIAQAPDRTSDKRPRDNAYLIRSATSPWTLFESPLDLRMRNRRGDPIVPTLESETALFTLEQMPSGSRFVADIHPLDATDSGSVAALIAALAPLLNPASGAPPLRIGRGGAPVLIEGWCPLATPATGAVAPGAGDGLTLTLVTDLIARTPDLGFHTALTVAALKDCLPPDLARSIADADRAGETSGYSDSLRYHGFNATAGLPGAPRIAIRRGSVLRVKGPCAAALQTALRGRTALGEQTWEGNGRFALDLASIAEGIRRQAETPPLLDAPLNLRRARRDRVIAAAQALCADPATLAWLPGRSQLGNLRGWLANTQPTLTPEQLTARLNGFRAQVEARRGAQTWVRVFDDLRLPEKVLAACCTDGTCHTEDVELFLRTLTRHKRASEAAASDADQAPVADAPVPQEPRT